MIASELFQFKKGTPDRGKIWESIQERLNKLDHPKFTIKEKRGVRDRWNLLQAKFKRIQLEELQSSRIDCVLSEKDALIEEFCEKEDSLSAKDKKKSDDKEAAEEIRKKAMERMASKKKSNESVGGSAKKIRRSGGDAVAFLKEKAQSEYSIRQQELELQRKEQEARARQQELQI
ncbi:plectin-like [Montipora capricornis]|uniref:plectin-like n=1 Tax=Montipora capricornis TaxID=246305 RepID=UPI0035F20358